MVCTKLSRLSAVQDPGEGPTHTVEVYPLMIRCNDFCVSGASWYRHRQRFPGSSMTGFLRLHFHRMCERGEDMKEFFAKFDNSVLPVRRECHKEARRMRVEHLKDPKEEPPLMIWSWT